MPQLCFGIHGYCIVGSHFQCHFRGTLQFPQFAGFDISTGNSIKLRSDALIIRLLTSFHGQFVGWYEARLTCEHNLW
jgi:hypothetical protein